MFIKHFYLKKEILCYVEYNKNNLMIVKYDLYNYILMNYDDYIVSCEKKKIFPINDFDKMIKHVEYYTSFDNAFEGLMNYIINNGFKKKRLKIV